MLQCFFMNKDTSTNLNIQEKLLLSLPVPLLNKKTQAVFTSLDILSNGSSCFLRK